MVAVARICTVDTCLCLDCWNLTAKEKIHHGSFSTVVEYKHPLPVELTFETKPQEKPKNNFTWAWADGSVQEIATYSSASTITTTIVDIDPREHPVRSAIRHRGVWPWPL